MMCSIASRRADSNHCPDGRTSKSAGGWRSCPDAGWRPSGAACPVTAAVSRHFTQPYARLGKRQRVMVSAAG